MPATRTALITFLLSSVALAVAPAQSSSRPVSLGVEGGWSAPAGSAQAFKRGYQLGGLAEFRTPLAWIAIRVDGGYQSLGSTTAAATDLAGNVIASERTVSGLFSASANLALRAPNLHTAVRPYALVGVGSYWLHSRSSPASTFTLNEPTRWFNGSDAAVGLEASFARVVAFTEARYQSLAGTPRRFVPITLGLRLP